MVEGKVLKKPLGYASELDVDMVGGQFASNRGAVGIAGAVQVLIAIAPPQGLHALHPEVIAVGTEDMHGLAKAHLNPESVAVELKYFEGGEGEVRGEQKDRAAIRMANDDEADESANRSPHEVQTVVAQRHIAFAIDGTGCVGEGGFVLCEVLEANLCPVDFGSSPLAAQRCRHLEVGDGVAFGTCHKLMSLAEQREHKLAAAVVGISDENYLAIPDARDREEQRNELVEQGPVVSIGEHETLVDARGQRDSGHMPGRPSDEQRDSLTLDPRQRMRWRGKGMTHDVCGFGVAGRLLMQQFDARHALPFFGRLDAIGEDDQPGSNLERPK